MLLHSPLGGSGSRGNNRMQMERSCHRAAEKILYSWSMLEDPIKTGEPLNSSANTKPDEKTSLAKR